jgi:hypothetical protein
MRKVLVYNGGAVALEPFPAGVGGGANYTHQSTALWNHDQITALPETSLLVAPAPGDGRLIVPVMSIFHREFVAPYTNIAAGGYAVFADPTDSAEIGGYFQGVNAGAFLNFLTTIHSGGPSDAPGGALVPEDVHDLIGQPLHFYMDNDGAGPLTEGHADNTLRVILIHWVVDLTTGLLVAA